MFINYWNQFKYRKVVKGIVEKIKEDNKEPKIEYILEVYTTDGKMCDFSNSKSVKAYFKFIEWYMCSDNLYYNFRYIEGMRIFTRDKISSINVFEKKENEK